MISMRMIVIPVPVNMRMRTMRVLMNVQMLGRRGSTQNIFMSMTNPFLLEDRCKCTLCPVRLEVG